MITINMDRAKQIKQQMVRNDRGPLLQALDVAYMRALEVGDSVELERIAHEKQRLRDAPEHPSILNAATPEDLKAADPLAAE